jgi:ubiquinone/menaquinone biosynthesis C-methylase UbiE
MIVETEWDTIARSFNQTRHQPWQEVLDFLDGRGGNGVVIACGNGRHLLPMARQCDEVLGIDRSVEMARITSERIAAEKLANASVLVGTATRLPLQAGIGDCILFIAGLHNIAGRSRRIRALTEVNRVLSYRGTALISVWARWQDRFLWPMVRQALVPWKNRGDIQVPWNRDGSAVMRFYHLYTLGELLDDLQTAGLRVVRVWSTTKASQHRFDNHFVELKKGTG